MIDFQDLPEFQALHDPQNLRDFKISEFKDFQDSKVSRIQEFKHTRIQELKNSSI